MNKGQTLGTLVLAAAIGLTSCAKLSNNIKRDGSFWGTTTAPYVVIKQSGGKITDVYKLENAYIQSETQSDGWLFVDSKQRPIHMGGDMKSIRFNSTYDELWNEYHEYHMEFESKSYQELYCNEKDSVTKK
jgi:hypothetical protein